MQAKTIFSNLYTSKYFANLPEFQRKRTQSFITLALTLAALGFFGLFAIMPTVSTIANLQKQKDDNTFVEEKLDQKKTSLVTLSQSYGSIQPDLPIIFSAMPKTADVSTLTGQLYALGKTANVKIVRIQTSEVDLTKTQEGVQQFSSFPFTIEATGSYNDLNAFITSITNFERLVMVNTITVARGDTGVLKMSIQAKAYFKL